MAGPAENPHQPCKVLVTGATGFVGSHALEMLLDRNDLELHAIRRWSSRTDLIAGIPGVEDRIKWHVCDLTDPFSVDHVIGRIRPDRILHLGAQSFVSPSWEAPELYFRTNVSGTLNVLEALRRHDLLQTRILIPGSGEEYGDVAARDLPIGPDTPLRPVNPYAVSKVAQNLLGYEHWRSYGIQVVRVRAFNHEGPRRDRVFALPSFAWQIAGIEAGIRPAVIRVGTLEALRNWTDVRDMVRAYWLALDKCPPGELFLVGSDDVRTVRACLDFMVSLSPARDRIRVETDPELVRPTEPLTLVADTSPFREATGWCPRIPFEDTLRDTLEYWRSRVRRDKP
jgi:GDP-4-dehydro-6-deoxy-D-mannose reductase